MTTLKCAIADCYNGVTSKNGRNGEVARIVSGKMRDGGLAFRNLIGKVTLGECREDPMAAKSGEGEIT